MGGTAVSKPKPREFRPQEVTYTSTFTIVYSTDAAGRNTYRLATPAAPMAKGEAVAVTIDRNPDAAGWDFIRFTADKALLSRDQAEAYYAAGYAEGLLTADSIYSSFVTAMSQDGDPHLDVQMNSTESRKWLDTHLKFMRDLGSKNTTRYGVMVKSLLRQIDGMHAGYNVAVQNLTGDDAPEPMSWLEMFYLSFQSEMNHAVNGANAIYDEDELLQQLEENTTYINKTRSTNSSNGTAFSQLRGSAHSSQHRRFTPVSHCSALLRVTGNDIFIGHDTWSSFNTMVRQYKTYALAGTVTMSGYPGSLSSVDDWFMTGAKLAVTETSIILETDTLDDEIRPESVSEFVRVMVANYLATSAKEWVDLFSGHNSGTYNNQYLILDTNKAAKRLTNTTGVFQRFDPDTFWVLEQTVGLIVARDQTNLLNDQRYFASYDLPYFIEVFNRSGFQDDASFAESHAVDPRARLFRRMSPNITDLGGMYTIMRYNNYEKDDESLIQICIDGSFRCWNNRSAMQSIAARGDLAPPDFDFPGDALEYLNELGRINYGAIDTKITSVRMMQEENNAGIAVNGPTSESVPPFNTTKFILENGENSNDDILDGVEWRGVPRFFNFPPVKLVHVVKPGDSKAAALKHVADSIVTSRRRTKRGRKDRSVERHRGGPLDSSHHLEFATDAGLVAPMRDDDPLQGDTRSGRIGASSAVGFVVAVCACVAVFATIRRRSRQRQPLSAPGEGYVGLL